MTLRKILSLILCLAILCSALALTACKKDPDPEEPVDEEYVPVLRFAITSDVHVRVTNNDYGSKQKLEDFINSAYKYAQGDSKYSALDGIFIVGDITQNGKTA